MTSVAVISDEAFIGPIDEAMATGDYVVRTVKMPNRGQAEILMDRLTAHDTQRIFVPASVARYVKGRYMRG